MITPTMQWAVANGHKTHPALLRAIREAMPLLARNLWALRIAQAFDAGVQAERNGELPKGAES